MRNLLLCVFLFSFLFVSGQTRRVQLDWGKSSQKLSTLVSSQKPKALETNLFFILEENKYVEQWVDNSFANPSSIKLSNIVFETVSANDLIGMEVSLIPKEVKYSISSNLGRDIIYTSLTFTPVISQNGIYKKVMSFDVAYTKNLQNNNRSIGLSNSVLATGSWFRFKVEKTGIHRIDRNFLNSLGINSGNIDPRKIKIYGNGGNMLLLRNSENTEFDLTENAIQVIGEQDGSFDPGDFILFYGETQQFNKDSNTHINLYDDNAYYYITADGENGKRISLYNEPSGAATTIITQFNDYQYHEIDDANPALVGRRWFGNRFDINNEQSFEFSFPNIISGQPMQFKLFAIAASEILTSMTVSVNGQLQILPNFGATSNINLASGRSIVSEINATSETVTVDLNYNNGGNPSGIAFLDYISINALRQLSGTDGQLPFKYDASATLSGIGEYQINNAAQFSEVWDVTNSGTITTVLNENASNIIAFKAQLGDLRKYVALNPSDFYQPIKTNQSRITNQNLKGTIFLNEQGNFQDIDYLIITPPFLLQAALRLANHHKNSSGMRVKVVTTDKIYTEFSTGKQDIAAIRNFVKYIYDNASSESNKLKYLCLFGDTSVDYKNRIQGNNNIVPTYHQYSDIVLSSLNTYMSDDFYGMMDANEGAMGSSDRLDIAIGRIITDKVTQANALVDKVINYLSPVSFGNWRNNFVLISDDADNLSDSNLQFKLDQLGDEIGAQKPSVNIIKIHSDAFQQETSSGGNRYPKATEAINDAIEVGALVMNYFGHGGEDGLAKEFIVTKGSVQSLKNKNRYPLFVTVTCEYSRFDNPLRPTAGEFTYWNKEGGAIALISTTRSIGVTLGREFNDTLASNLYAFGSSNFIPPAEAVRRTKNIINNEIRRVIFYIGDPAMPLGFPKQEVRLTTLNGVPIGQATDTLKALSKVKFGGEVVNQNGNIISGYNGILEAKVFDKRVQRQTLGNDDVRDVDNNLIIMNFETLGEGLFNGQASVTNGLFEFEFVVPRDIAIPVGTGRVSLYSKKNQALEDHAGANETILIGGLNENAPEDNIGPQIRLFLNDESFVSGGITNNSPILIAKLEDDNGINTASGIGHDIVAIIDGDEANPFVLNDYYLAEVDDFTKGSLNYRLRDLEVGLHTLTLKAWDVYNNSATTDIQFVVAGSDEIKIERVLNYPNPFVNYTEFWFNHNRPFEPLEVQVQVFTVTGKIVWTKNQIILTEGFLSRDIVWDGKDDFGDRIGKGVYVYKLTVKSTLTNKKVEKFEKLVIL
ncbi:MAG: peptidase C25 [Bacteroidetes bacterium HGW-Bacteroidetes-2]|nr:MAG: peptidase C25 [Bacteroidetes bacterium HGW-Bacteroidetes-2]